QRHKRGDHEAAEGQWRQHVRWLYSDVDPDAAAVRVLRHAAEGGGAAAGALFLAARPAVGRPVPHSADRDGGVSVPRAVLYAVAGRGSAAAEDDGVHDAGLLGVHDVELRLGSGAVLVGG